MTFAVFVGTIVSLRFARREGRSIRETVQLGLYVAAFAFPCSLLFNGMFYRPEALTHLLAHPEDVTRTVLGWSSYGGILGAILGGWVWKWRTEGSMLTIGDSFAFAGPFAFFLGRVGCFVVHDHPGRVSNFFLAVADYRTGAPPYLPRHDLGLYDALLLAAIAAVFLLVSRTPRKPGFYVGLFAVLYTPGRFLLDFLRAPAAEGGDLRYAGLTPAQFVSVALFVAGVAVLRQGTSARARSSNPIRTE